MDEELSSVEAEIPKERIIANLEKHFDLSREKAEAYYVKYKE